MTSALQTDSFYLLRVILSLFQVSEVGHIVQMLHNASLLVDDIEDHSILRRGIPVAHKVEFLHHLFLLRPHLLDLRAIIHLMNDLGTQSYQNVFCQNLLNA